MRPRSFLPLLLVLSACSATACSSGVYRAQAYPGTAPSAATSYPSSSSSSASTAPSMVSTASPPPEQAHATLTRHTKPVASLAVRPDVIELPFALRAVVDEPDLGVRILEQAARNLEERFAEVVPKGALRARMRGASFDRAARGAAKLASASKARSATHDGPEYPTAVVLQGSFEVALASSQDYWERSRELARLTAVIDRAKAASQSDGAFSTSFGPVEPHVRDPQAFRAELVQKWGTQRRQGVREARSADAPLAPDACKAPGEVVEKVVSLEEVELTLTVECKGMIAPSVSGSVGSQKRAPTESAPVSSN